MKVNLTSSNPALESIFLHPDQVITLDANFLIPPDRSRLDDRGEVKSLSYIAVKGLPYFAANDSNVIRLIENAESWNTGLDNVQVIRMYELIFYLHKMNQADNKSLKMLYKYQYHLTQNEKKDNPSWGQFIDAMETLYPD